MGSPHAEAYVSCMRLLFETYAAQMEPMLDFVRHSLPIETVEWKHPRTGEPLAYRDAEKDDTLKRWADSAYRSTVRAHACDVLRSYLPAATLTNVGLFGVGQAFEHLLTKLYSLDLAEAQDIAEPMHKALNVLTPSFVKRARRNDYLVETAESSRKLADALLAGHTAEPTDTVTLVDYDRDAEEKILAAVLYPNGRLPLAQLRTLVEKLSSDERNRIFETYIGQRRHRRDKPGRALEHGYYTFDILGNLGLYRDLQRHRILTQERQAYHDGPRLRYAAGNRGGRLPIGIRGVHGTRGRLVRTNRRGLSRRSAVRRAVRVPRTLVHEAQPARGHSYRRTTHHAAGTSRLPFRRAGDVAADR